MATGAAPLLPNGPWTASPDTAWDPGASRITHTDGRSIRIDTARRDGYVHASVVYPHPIHHPLHVGDSPVTELRASRGAQALASAIARKLLPIYNETFAKVVAADAAHAEAQRFRQEFAEQLVDLIPGACIAPRKPALVEHRGPGITKATVEVSSDGHHTIELNWVSSATVQAVMQACAETTPACDRT